MSLVDFLEENLWLGFRCMGIIEVAPLGEKEGGRHGREGKGGKQGFDLSVAPAWPHGEPHSMRSTIELHPEAQEPTFGIPLTVAALWLGQFSEEGDSCEYPAAGGWCLGPIKGIRVGHHRYLF